MRYCPIRLWKLEGGMYVRVYMCVRIFVHYVDSSFYPSLSVQPTTNMCGMQASHQSHQYPPSAFYFANTLRLQVMESDDEYLKSKALQQMGIAPFDEAELDGVSGGHSAVAEDGGGGGNNEDEEKDEEGMVSYYVLILIRIHILTELDSSVFCVYFSLCVYVVRDSSKGRLASISDRLSKAEDHTSSPVVHSDANAKVGECVASGAPTRLLQA